MQGQLCPTWQSYAGLPPEEGAYVTFYAIGALEWGSIVLGDFGVSLRCARNDSKALRDSLLSLFFKQHQV